MNNNEMEFDFLNNNEKQNNNQSTKKDFSNFLSFIIGGVITIIAYMGFFVISAFCFIIKAVATIFLLSSFKSKKKRKKGWF